MTVRTGPQRAPASEDTDRSGRRAQRGLDPYRIAAEPPESPTHIHFRLDPDQLVIQGVGVASHERRAGLATDMALRLRYLVAQTRRTFIQGSFSEAGLAWALHMNKNYSFHIM